MKGIAITTQNEMSVQDYGEPLYQTVGKTVGGYIEIVRPRGLEHPLCMIVNEEGRIHNLDLKFVGSMLYGTPVHGQPIVGPIVIMKEGYRNGEPDIIGMTDGEVETVKSNLKRVFGAEFFKEASE